MAEGALLKLPSCHQGDKASGGTERRCCPPPPCPAQCLFCSAVLTHVASFLDAPPQPTEEEWLQFRVTVAGKALAS